MLVLAQVAAVALPESQPDHTLAATLVGAPVVDRVVVAAGTGGKGGWVSPEEKEK